MEMYNVFSTFELVHNFMYPDEPLKPWINIMNYSNIYIEDWNALMELAQRCYDDIAHIADGEDTNIIGEITHNLLDFNKEATYLACAEAIDWYNKNKI